MQPLRKEVISILLIVICSLIIFFSLSITAESFIPPLGPILSRGLMSESGPDWECNCPASILEWDCICKYNSML